MGEAKRRADAARASYPHGVVIQCLGMVGPIPEMKTPMGCYLKDADHDYQDGKGFAVWTGKIEDARVFPDVATARRFHEQVSRARPTHPHHGGPNRPLMIYGVAFDPAPPPGHKSRPFVAPGAEFLL